MKYAALGEHPRSLPGTTGDVTLRFEEIEKPIGAELPKSAHTDRECGPIRMAALRTALARSGVSS